jgi:hypothetical protein
MSQPNTGTGATTYEAAREYVETTPDATATVVAASFTQSEAIATYFHDDLERFLQRTQLSLFEYLQVPGGMTPRELLNLLYDDLAHLLRDRLITGMHIILYNPTFDATRQAYPIVWHAQYLIEWPARVLNPGSQPAESWGGRLNVPEGAWMNAKFAIIIDWAADARDRRSLARRANGYWFDWVARGNRYDASSLVQYQNGGMSVEGAVVRRDVSAVPGAQRP